MYRAVDSKGKSVDVEYAISNPCEKYYCPQCNGELRTKKGNINIHHFAHISLNDCDSFSQDMSEWHRLWQNEFPIECREVVIECDGAKHRADVCVGKYVIEFQHSPISQDEFDERNRFYTSAGYKLIWIFDIINEWDCGRIFILDPDEYVWKNPRKFLRNWNYENKDIFILFQMFKRSMKDEHILHERYFQKVTWTITDYYGLSDFQEFHTSDFPKNIDELKEFIGADLYLNSNTITEGNSGRNEAELIVRQRAIVRRKAKELISKMSNIRFPNITVHDTYRDFDDYEWFNRNGNRHSDLFIPQIIEVKTVEIDKEIQFKDSKHKICFIKSDIYIESKDERKIAIVIIFNPCEMSFEKAKKFEEEEISIYELNLSDSFDWDEETMSDQDFENFIVKELFDSKLSRWRYNSDKQKIKEKITVLKANYFSGDVMDSVFCPKDGKKSYLHDCLGCPRLLYYNGLGRKDRYLYCKNYLTKAVSVVLMNEGQIQELLSIIDDNKGNIPVYFKVGANGEKCKSKVNIDLNYSTLAKLQGKFGSGVKIHYNT